jgi:glycosidase
MLGCEKTQQYQMNHRLPQLLKFIPHLKRLSVNAIYLGPIFQSMSHGYDTIDYLKIDDRLGNHQDFIEVVEQYHKADIKVIVDAVFHHVGREFFAFQDFLKHRGKSKYLKWFCHVDFNKDNVFHDGFCYDTWKGAAELVKLNLANPDVMQYIIGCIEQWIDEYHIDGLRLDAAECMIFPFFECLNLYFKKKYPDFYLMGEVVFGDYQQWIYPYRLDAVTNYELYHALHHAHNTCNYHELEHTLNRQFGEDGLYQNLCLYNFVDNHDVNRIASLLKRKENLKNIYTLLFTLPGVPSIYYGSEFGIKGCKQRYSDDKLRIALDLTKKRANVLMKHIAMLAKLRTQIPELQKGSYRVLYCSEEQIVFMRKGKNHTYIFVNQSEETVKIKNPLKKGCYKDLFTNQFYEDSFITIEGFNAMILVDADRKDCL